MNIVVPECECKVIQETDVLVCGGGPSGIGAALSAARHGAQVVIVDEGGCYGGSISKAMISSIMGGVVNSGDKILIKGIWSEVMDRMVEKKGAIWGHELINSSKFHPYDKSRCEKDLQISIFEPDIFRAVIEEMLIEEKNIHKMLFTKVTGVIKEKNKVKGVVIDNNEGKQVILAKRIIDATSSGAIARMAGASWKNACSDEPEAGPVLVFFRVGGVDEVCASYKPDVKEIPYGAVNFFPFVRPNEYRVEMTRALGNYLNIESYTEATLKCRQQIPEIIEWLRKNWPGCENIYLISSAIWTLTFAFPKIIGKSSMTQDQILGNKIPEDVIYLTGYGIDIHSSEVGGQNTLHFLNPGEFYGVGFGTMIPKSDIKNLLVLGRAVSTDDGAEASIISAPTSMSGGQAAGCAMALSLQKDIDVRDINIKELQETLRKDGVIFEPEKAIRKREPLVYHFTY